METLSPVKNLEAAKVVIGAGADAIYFASPSFGARTNASIDLEEIKEIITYAKENYVKTYATFNTVIFDSELNQFFYEIDQLYQMGVDAIIVQDISFANILKKNYPNLDIHASTQMHVHNTPATKYIKDEGCNRVVVPREMNFDRIKQIKQACDIEVEAFVHGALCVSYSGQCYDSTLLDQKSANRGRCSQYCRMPQYVVYTPNGKVVSQGEYPLNLKDLNNIDNLEKYKEAGVDSLKIEGRLKSVDYAYQTTKAYKEKLESSTNLDLEDVYNREFTSGRIDSKNGREIVNLYRPNNNGKLIGVVEKVEINKAKSLQYYPYAVTVKTVDNKVINVQDNIRYVAEDFEDGQIVEQYKKLGDNLYLIFSKVKPEVEDEVYRTQNANIFRDAKEVSKNRNRKQIKLNLFLKNNVLFYAFEKNAPVNTNIKFESAKSKPTTKEEILAKLSKTKNTPFDLVVEDFKYDDDKFCQISKINNLKKDIINKLIDEQEIRVSNLVEVPNQELEATAKEKEFYIEVSGEEQYEIVKKKIPEANVLINNIDFANSIVPKEKDYFVLPSIIYDDENYKIDQVCQKFNNIVVSELGAFNKYKDSKNVITNYTLNTTNYINQQKLVEDGAQATILSIELNQEKLKTFGNDFSIVNIYGRIPVMIMDYCPINMKKTDSCQTCTKCRDGQYHLEDKLGREFPLAYAGNNRISMLSRKPISLLARQSELFEVGISKYYLRFTTEDRYDVQEVLENLIDEENDLSFEVNSGSYFKETL